MVQEQYAQFVDKLKSELNEFLTLAEEGKGGRGSKTKALAARKLSMKIASSLKGFRALSIQNDKAK